MKNGSKNGHTVTCLAHAELSTMFGHFIIKGYSADGGQSVALLRGTPGSHSNVLARIQSSCLFGESFHATDCDCSWQVTTSLRRIAQEGNGIFIYLFQEGRGVGIFEKIKALNIQQTEHCDTVEAFNKMGIKKSDLRTYDLAANILQYEGIRSVRLLTNNEDKVRSLIDNGIAAVGESLELEEADFKKLTAHMDEKDIKDLIEYLKVKRDKLGHDIILGFAKKVLRDMEQERKR